MEILPIDEAVGPQYLLGDASMSLMDQSSIFPPKSLGELASMTDNMSIATSLNFKNPVMMAGGAGVKQSMAAAGNGEAQGPDGSQLPRSGSKVDPDDAHHVY